ncbi:hypothetical protein PI124_g4280 [Phytophthora idaei]|nr:hypothetical protein PI124_g4280 [Phytophthora idaei]
MYMASLHFAGSKRYCVCSGTLTAPQVILTAAHCMEWSMVDVYVSLGSKHKSGGGSRKSEMIRVVEAFRYPLYNISNEYAVITRDVALLKLETPSKIQPEQFAAADGSENEPGTMATTLG